MFWSDGQLACCKQIGEVLCSPSKSNMLMCVSSSSVQYFRKCIDRQYRQNHSGLEPKPPTCIVAAVIDVNSYDYVSTQQIADVL